MACVVIGGIAVLAHIPYRTTRDLDVLIQPTRRVESEFLGVPTSFAGVDSLIRMKRATGNVEKDLPDVNRLEALRGESE